jgi:hypothetical protein
LKFKNEIFYHEFKKSKIKYLNNFSPAPWKLAPLAAAFNKSVMR